MPTVKKAAALMLSAALLLGLCACSPNPSDGTGGAAPSGDIVDPETSPPAASPVQEPPTPSPTPKPTETAAPLPTPEPSPLPSQALTPEEPSPTPEQTPVPPTASVPPAETENPASSPALPGAEPTPGEQIPEESVSVDFASFLAGIISEYDFKGMGDYDTALLDGYYPGLTAIPAKQRIVQAPMISASAVEIALIECENTADAETAASIFSARIQAQIDGGAWYPASIEQWKNAKVVSYGCCVMMVSAGDNSQAIADAFAALFADAVS